MNLRGAVQGLSDSRRGVTLIEMLVVVTIISVFLLVSGPNLLGHAEKGKVVAARQQIQMLEHALLSYKLDIGSFPSAGQGLAALREKPAQVDAWRGLFAPRTPYGSLGQRVPVSASVGSRRRAPHRQSRRRWPSRPRGRCGGHRELEE